MAGARALHFIAFLAWLFQSGPPAPQPFGDTAQAVFLVALALRALGGPLLYAAARNRPGGREAWWGTFGALVPLLAVAMFAVSRPKPRGAVMSAYNPWVFCPYCRMPRGYSGYPCPQCGQFLPTSGPGWPPVFAPPPAPVAPEDREDPGKVDTWQVLGAVALTFVLASVGLYLLLFPMLTDPLLTQARIDALLAEPSFVLVTLVVQDSIMVAIALDQGVFRRRLSWSEMGVGAKSAAWSLQRKVGVGVLAGGFTFAVSAVTLQILMNTLQAAGIDPGPGGQALDPRIASASDYGFWIVSGAVIAPIAEELFFRGYALPGFVRRGMANRGLIVTSVIFAAIHMNFIAFGPLMVAGLVLGALRLKTGSLAAPIAGHAANNFIVMTLTLMGI